jgi:cell division protein FtsQ
VIETDNKETTYQTSSWRYAGLLSILFACALLLSFQLGYSWLCDAKRFPVNTVKISANYEHLSHKALENTLNPYLQYSFFALPASQLQDDLRKLAWVDKVSVERVWPDCIKITLAEKKPVAKWQTGLLTENGQAFNPEGNLADLDLPQLNGPTDSAQEVLQVYEKLSKILSGYGLYATGLQLRDNLAWELTLSSGAVLRLGKKDTEARLMRFCKAYPAVFADKIEELASVDLRYPRGMAVQWKQEAGR